MNDLEIKFNNDLKNVTCHSEETEDYMKTVADSINQSSYKHIWNLNED